MTNHSDFFGGAPTLSFSMTDASGQHVDDPSLLNVLRGGLIAEEPVIVQQTNIGTGTPLTWSDGRPKMQMIVTLVCDGTHGLPNGAKARDERTGGTDDGKRRLYIKSGAQTAIGNAIRAAGASGLAIGGVLLLAWTGTQTSKTPGHRPARVYQAVYQPPSVSIPESSEGSPFGGGAPAPQPPAAAPPADPPMPPVPASPFGAPAPAQAALPAPAAPVPSANPFG